MYVLLKFLRGLCFYGFWVIVLSVVTLGCAGDAATDETNISDRSMPAKPWGFYQILWRPEQFAQQLDRELQVLGGSPSYVLFFRDLHPRRSFPREVVEICAARDVTPVISLELTQWGQDKKEGYLQDIIAGQYDEWFRVWGAAAAEWRKPVFLRFGFEMNGDWFSWGQQPEQFRQAWRRAHTRS